ENWSPENVYIRQMFLNGAPYDKSYLTYDDIKNGAELHFVMDAAPNYRRAVKEASVPPSLSGTGKPLRYKVSTN
ncbi:MAG: glycoside hydrolase family 92 protein, partial [Odoribacteraceae bacterium]|nr:glycoside hydrolase family 92 protein [Odoribacteraceae bacterium]